MELYQLIIVLLFLFINIILFVKGFIETKYKKNAYKLVPFYLIITGIFVWGDAVVISMFWVLASLFSLIVGNWILFLLIISSFWFIRALGEATYWFNQQHSKVIRYSPKEMIGYNIYHNDSIWFGYQIFAQCIAVISFILTIYLSYLFLTGL
jgi:hypothetical protein